MRVIRLFVDQPLAASSEFELDETEIHHAVNVLRIHKHSNLRIFNGDGYDYECGILEYSKKKLRVAIINKLSVENESSLAIHLILAVSKSSHMDYAIQKAVEAGVTSIQPIQTERTVPSRTSKSTKNKHKHWRNIIIHACEQCGRAVIPTLYEIQEFNSLRNKTDFQNSFILDAESDQKFSSYKNLNIDKLRLLIGPEGGFTQSEINVAKEAGFFSVKLGKRILRTETAALAAIIVAQTIWGDLA